LGHRFNNLGLLRNEIGPPVLVTMGGRRASFLTQCFRVGGFCALRAMISLNRACSRVAGYASAMILGLGGGWRAKRTEFVGTSAGKLE
jgi:hypothetical protein